MFSPGGLPPGTSCSRRLFTVLLVRLRPQGSGGLTSADGPVAAPGQVLLADPCLRAPQGVPRVAGEVDLVAHRLGLAQPPAVDRDVQLWTGTWGNHGHTSTHTVGRDSSSQRYKNTNKGSSATSKSFSIL